MFSNFKRQAIAKETKSYFDEILQTCGDRIINSVKHTKFYVKTFPLKQKHHFETKYRILNKDTIDLALKLQKEGLNPCVLNMASIFKPGGGWMTGAPAQEEQLFYRSTYDLALTDPKKMDVNRRWKYPIPTTGGIYTPDVFVFRDNEKNGYTVWDYPDCKYVNFVAVAALKRPLVVNDMLTDFDAKLTKEKIRTMLRISLIHGHTSVLLSAFGCGAYGNPPKHIAQLFKQVFDEMEFKHQFTDVIFGILKTGKNDNNFEIFSRAFSDKIYATLS